ncbi:MAG: PQQ-binding-like beta-propeller repeat protein, partial [Planctomycetota bacterium]
AFISSRTSHASRMPKKTPAIVELRPFVKKRISKPTIDCARKGFKPETFTVQPIDAEGKLAPFTVRRHLLKEPTWQRHVGGIVEATPAVWGRRVAVAGRDGRWFLLDAQTGRVVDSNRIQTLDGIAAGMVSDGKNFYVAALEGQLYAYSGETGKFLYKIADFPGKLHATPAAAGGVIYVVDYRGNVRAYRAGARRPLWEVSTAPGVRAAPLVPREHLIVVSLSGDVSVIRRQDGKLAAPRFRLKGTFTLPPTAAGADLLFASDEGWLYAVEKLTGKERWRSQVGQTIRSQPIVRGGAVFLSPTPGQLLVVDTSTGDEIYRFAEGGGAHAVVVGKVHIYFAHGRDLTAYARTADGYGLVWTFRAKARILAGPIHQGSAVFIGDEKGNVYRVDLDR